MKILKVMNTATRRLSLEDFTRMVGLTPSQALRLMQELANVGLLKKVGGGFSITEAGKKVFMMFVTVPDGLEFRFFTGIGNPTGFSARNLQEFLKSVREIDAIALEFHIFRKDFENWALAAFDDVQLVDKFRRIRESGITGEKLRDEIVEMTDTRYKEFERILSSRE